MRGLFDSVSFLSFFYPPKTQAENEKTLFWLLIIVSLFAFLEFGQDYISSVLNSSDFSITQSLVYKLFWFVFIPFTFLLFNLQNMYSLNVGKWKGVLQKSFLIIGITLLHLLVFSLLLYIISFIINDEPWSLTFLLTQKLSTRLWLGLSFYIVCSFIYYNVDRKVFKSKERRSDPDTLRIKSGSKTSLVDFEKIKWIVSDGPYLEVHTLHNKYVVLDSLKNIIDSLPKNFRRIHKSTIVNIEQIESSRSRGNGDFDLLLKCGKKVRLSRNYAKPLKGILH